MRITTPTPSREPFADTTLPAAKAPVKAELKIYTKEELEELFIDLKAKHELLRSSRSETALKAHNAVLMTKGLIAILDDESEESHDLSPERRMGLIRSYSDYISSGVLEINTELKGIAEKEKALLLIKEGTSQERFNIENSGDKPGEFKLEGKICQLTPVPVAISLAVQSAYTYRGEKRVTLELKGGEE